MGVTLWLLRADNRADMDLEQRQLLSLTILPARLNSEQAAWLLGVRPESIAVLCKARVLVPLGNPPLNGVKYFATCVLSELRNDARWLARASDAIYRHWQFKNSQKRKGKTPLLKIDHPSSAYTHQQPAAED